MSFEVFEIMRIILKNPSCLPLKPLKGLSLPGGELLIKGSLKGPGVEVI
jgi:hypothetical protein